MKTINATVYRSDSGDCSFYGMSHDKKNLTLVYDYNESELEDIKGKNFVAYGTKCIGTEITHYAYPIINGKIKWGMFGGNFLFTSDSRFPVHHPIRIMDRFENRNVLYLEFSSSDLGNGRDYYKARGKEGQLFARVKLDDKTVAWHTVTTALEPDCPLRDGTVVNVFEPGRSELLFVELQDYDNYWQMPVADKKFSFSLEQQNTAEHKELAKIRLDGENSIHIIKLISTNQPFVVCFRAVTKDNKLYT